MGTPNAGFTRRILALGMIASVASLLGAKVASGQGCMPIRLASQVIGSQGDVYLPRGRFQTGLAYRHYRSDQFFLGHEVRNDLSPHGIPTLVKSNAVSVNLAYGVTDRLALSLDVPFSQNSHTAWYADGQRHENTATGLGEVTLVASYWLRKANAVAPWGNLAIGVGVKTPGNNKAPGKIWQKNGSTMAFPSHPAIQLGDGGWGIILQAQGFQPIVSRVYLYAAASYTLSTKDSTDVARGLNPPGSTLHLAVPDVWGARAGVAMAVWPTQGVSASVGARFDGTPRRDLIGGKDMNFRIPATVGYLDPGVAIIRGRHTVTLNVPVRVYFWFRPSYLDQQTGRRGGGGLPRYMLLPTYTFRF